MDGLPDFFLGLAEASLILKIALGIHSFLEIGVCQKTVSLVPYTQQNRVSLILIGITQPESFHGMSFHSTCILQATLHKTQFTQGVKVGRAEPQHHDPGLQIAALSYLFFGALQFTKDQ